MSDSLKNTKQHLKNIEYLSKGREDLLDYSYLNSCFICGKELRWFDILSHGFDGNYHKIGCNWFARLCSFIFTILIIPRILIGIFDIGR